ncbi:MAG: hypothetical protein K5821_16105 [Nitrobacter sp.]|uniref:hypothetical protein n=1 Tax=Nitrobacter sp. TaxID=29420 RepID=UPI002608B558|nr:hypothetical protein [Nitrobacter sp.]MCV0387891.1 hypothetical protein [Nitrobacter sp.]
MTRQEQLDLIRAACIEANPSDTTLRDQNSWQGLQIKRKYGRPIRLADVLLAITKATNPIDGKRADAFLDVIERYDLRKDDSTMQSDEWVAFLADLLAKN